MYRDQNITSKPEFFRFFLMFFFLLLILSSITNISSFINKQASAQTLLVPPSPTQFLTYENSSLGIKMQYPSDWKKVFDSTGGIDDSTGGIEEIRVHFISPQPSPNARKADVLLTVEDLPNLGIQLQLKDIVKEQILSDKEAYLDYHLIESVPITIAGIPAYKTTSTSTIIGKHIEFVDIRVINNNKLYSIIFGTGLAEYATYLPIVQKMINSFEFVK